MTRRLPWFRAPVVRLLIAVGLAGAVAAGTLLAAAGERLPSLRAQALDWFFPSGEPDPAIVVVGIDRRSIAELDAPWPWSRQIHATMLERLTEAGADVVAFDIVLDLPGEGDEALAAAIADHGRVVLAADAIGVRTVSQLRTVDELRRPLDVFAEPAAAVAHPFVDADPFDGVVRTAPLVLESPDRRLIPSLALAASTLADGGEPDVVVLRTDGVQAGDRVHPTEQGYTLRVNWAHGLEGPAAGTHLSAVDVYRGTFDADMVRDRTVLIGATDPLLGDNVLSPVVKSGAGTPGVYVHANAASTMQTSQYRGFPRPVETAAAAFALALVVGLTALFAPLWVTPLAALALTGAYFVGASLRFDTGQAMDPLLPTVGLVVAGLVAAGVRYLGEGRERRMVSSLFSQYVPKAVAQQLLAEGRTEVAAEGQRLDVTVLFCDLRGFTAIAATREPAEVRDMLSIYYEHGTRVVLDHGGTLMQYVGDEIFAVFGAPVPMDDHAQRALDCAVALQAAASDIVAALAQRGLPPLGYGVGLNTGPVVAAHIGGAVRKQYGCIGDTVNVGSRLCSLATAGEVVLPESVRRELTRAPELEPLGPVTLKGVSEDPRVTRVSLPGLVPLHEREDRGGKKAKIGGGSTS